VRPSGEVLHVTQHRLREKTYLSGRGFPVTPFRAVRSLAGLAEGLAALGCPALLKTAGWGYDGKGQVRVDSDAPAVVAAAWARIGAQEAVLEAFVGYEREVSVVAARGVDGQIVDFGVIENHHVGGILDYSLAPARISAATERRAREITRAVLEALEVVGVLCVEFFVLPGGELLINELAPRPHNSGHLTFDACLTSQFEQQLRAVCGLPLGATDLLRPAAMANLLGDLWSAGDARVGAGAGAAEHQAPPVRQGEARPGRKMGHLTALAADTADATARVLEARARLTAATMSTTGTSGTSGA
jgi:5-(carboxyamino)imidazole ribonucleotide synthase